MQDEFAVRSQKCADDADKAAFIRASARRRFQTERPEGALSWLGTIAVALLDIEDDLARWPSHVGVARDSRENAAPKESLS